MIFAIPLQRRKDKSGGRPGLTISATRASIPARGKPPAGNGDRRDLISYHHQHTYKMYYFHFSVNAMAALKVRRIIEKEVDRYERYRVSNRTHFLMYITEEGYERIIDRLNEILSYKYESLMPKE